MATNLRPEGTDVVVDDVVLSTPGLSGSVEVHGPRTPGMRGAEETTQAFLDALDQVGAQEQLTVEITDPDELYASGGTRGGGGGTQIELRVPAPAEGFGQVVLYTAEAGSLSWHLPTEPQGGAVGGPTGVAGQRGARRLTYLLPREVVRPEPGAQGHSRGVLGALGTKLFKVVVFPLVRPGLQRAAEAVAAHWEAGHRPARLRRFDPDSFTSATVPDLTPADVTALGEGPVLLFVHGTFVTSDTAFSGLPHDVLAELHHRYDGRVIALDHHTVSVTPSENIALLATQLGEGAHLTVDVVTHSRGGLVGRALAERGSELGLGDRVTVRHLVMVAPPNAGTPLADEHYLGSLLDRLTNLAQFIPGGGVTDILAGVLTVIQHLAVGAFSGLEGIMSMNPSGQSLKEFNTGPASAAGYRVVTADYEPKPGSPFARIVRDSGTDFVFRDATNDLVVPTAGSYDVPGAAMFPVADPLVLAASEGVDHGSYFSNAQVTAALLQWLPG